jgi:hypothetical protein
MDRYKAISLKTLFLADVGSSQIPMVVPGFFC